MPILVICLFKNVREKYGRGLGMSALPDLREANIVREGLILALEKTLDPSLGVIEGSVGADGIDTSPGSVTVFLANDVRTAGTPPIFPLYTVGDVKGGIERITELQKSIAEHFLIDKLIDFNSEVQQTLGEVEILNNKRSMALRSVFTRLITEQFTPMVRRFHAVLLRKGVLGLVPGTEETLKKQEEALINGRRVLEIPKKVLEKMLKGEDVFEIIYISPAAKMMQANKSQAILRTVQFAQMMSQTQQEAMDNINPDRSIREYGDTIGSPLDIFEDPQQVKITREQRAQAIQQQQQLASAQQAAQIGKTLQQ